MNQFWNINRLLFHSKTGQHVPNPGDVVFDETRGLLVVRDVDYTTGRSVLEVFEPPKKPEHDASEDILLGSGPGNPSEPFRVFLDTSVTPYVLTPEKRLHMYGSDVQYYKLFLGSSIGSKGKTIAFVRDAGGTVVGENIPFEAIDVPGSVHPTVRSPTSAYTTENLEDGERVTLVAYSANDRQVGTATLLVQRSGAVRYLDANRRYVRGISIDSPFITGSDGNTIEFPVNVPPQQLPMMGVIYYSDGTKQTLPIDGNRFRLHGAENYTATVQDEVFDLVLGYDLADDEISYDQKPTTNRRLMRPYRAKTIEANGAYSVKLFVYPVWEPDGNKYHLEYWLYNLDRQTFYDVTPKIELGSNSAAFNPDVYGSVQTITVAIDLNRVDARFKPVRHVQTFQVTLLARGTERTSNWIVKFRPDQPAGFGDKVNAKLAQGSVNSWKLDLKNDELTQQTWLNRLFYGVEPLFNSNIEGHVPAPTHFRIHMLHNTYERKVEQWDQVFDVVNDLRQGEVIYIQWIYRTDSTDLQLAITGLPAYIQ